MMEGSILRVVLVLICSLLVSAKVVDLTPDNFDSVVDGSKAAFVEFYAPWCGHCKNLAPEYELLGEAFDRETSVVIAKVDADQHRDLGSRFDVHGFPTLKFFPKGSKTPESYEGGRTAEDLINYINGKVGTNARLKKPPSNVVAVTDSDFDAVVINSDKHVLVEFYAPWCGHCKKLAPDYEKLANVYANEPTVEIVKIDADAHKQNAGKYGVTGFPTLKWFGKDKKTDPEAYEGGRDVESFVNFINARAGTKRTADGRLNAEAGRIQGLDEIAKQFVASADQAALLKQAEEAVKSLKGDDEKNGKFYIKVMEAVKSKGSAFLASEPARLDRMLEGASVSAQKVDEFTIRKNIIAAFSQ